MTRTIRCYNKVYILNIYNFMPQKVNKSKERRGWGKKGKKNVNLRLVPETMPPMEAKSNNLD